MREPEPGPDFPRLHIRPRWGWLNDPNGLCKVDGTYHVFFQHNPYEPVHGHVHWGHVSSTDLLTWTSQPLALVPQPGTPDAAGCWSGCVTDDGGTPTAIFTAVPDHAWNAGALLARGDATLQRWTPGGDFVAGPPHVDGVEEVRDPFVFSVDGHRYVVQGAGARRGRPQLLLWGADDLEHWVDLGPLLTEDDPVAAVVADANIWECPNLVRVPSADPARGARWVLLISLWRWVDELHELAGVRYLVGDLQPGGPGLRFVADSGGVLDDGTAYYAPQVLPDGDRVLVWGWAWEVGRSENQVRDAGWAGVLTFPRELVVTDDGALGARPATELEGLRAEPLAYAPDAPLEALAFELRSTCEARLRLVDGGREVFGLDVGGSADVPTTVLVDGSVLELFRGGSTRTERAYPTPTSRWFLDADPATVRCWRLALPAGPGAGMP